MFFEKNKNSQLVNLIVKKNIGGKIIYLNQAVFFLKIPIFFMIKLIWRVIIFSKLFFLGILFRRK